MQLYRDMGASHPLAQARARAYPAVMGYRLPLIVLNFKVLYTVS